MSTQDSRVDLVFEGGGVKGIGLAGAFYELDQRGYQPQCVAGTSAGAITAAMVAAGYRGDELKQVVLEEMHFPSFADRGRLEWLGPAGDAIEIVRDRGLHSGNYFEGWIASKLAARGVTSFGDLRNPGDSNPGREYRLQVIASDLTDQCMLVLPHDAAKLGIDPDKLSVAEAVRMSMSIPIFFDPVVHPHPQDNRRHLIVDGGLLSNFPVWLFDAPAGVQPRFPTFGMLLVTPEQRDPLVPEPPAGQAPMPSLVGYFKAIVHTMLEARDRFYVEQDTFARTIPIPTLGVTTTDFGISPQRAGELFESGRTAASKFLKTWDFGAYVAKHRNGASPARRESVLA